MLDLEPIKDRLDAASLGPWAAVEGVNTPTAFAPVNKRLEAAAAKPLVIS